VSNIKIQRPGLEMLYETHGLMPAADLNRWHYPFRIGAVSMFDGIDRDKILLDLNRLRLKYLTDT